METCEALRNTRNMTLAIHPSRYVATLILVTSEETGSPKNFAGRSAMPLLVILVWNELANCQKWIAVAESL